MYERSTKMSKVAFECEDGTVRVRGNAKYVDYALDPKILALVEKQETTTVKDMEIAQLKQLVAQSKQQAICDHEVKLELERHIIKLDRELDRTREELNRLKKSEPVHDCIISEKEPYSLRRTWKEKLTSSAIKEMRDWGRNVVIQAEDETHELECINRLSDEYRKLQCK